MKSFEGLNRINQLSITFIFGFACWVSPFKNKTFRQKSTSAIKTISVTCSDTLMYYDARLFILVIQTRSKQITGKVSFFILDYLRKWIHSSSFLVGINEVVFCIYHLHVFPYYWWMRGIMTSKVFILYLEIYISYPL